MGKNLRGQCHQTLSFNPFDTELAARSLKFFIINCAPRHAFSGPTKASNWNSSTGDEPAEFKALASNFHGARAALGRATYDQLGSEGAAAGHPRSLYVIADAPAGAALTLQNVRSIRPGVGLAPKHPPEVLEKRAGCPLKRGERLA